MPGLRAIARRVLTVGLLSVAASAEAAGFLTGDDLYHELAIPGYTEGVGFGYIQGVVDAAGSGRPTSMDRCFSIPGDVEAQQIEDIVRHYLDQHPATRQYSAAWLVEDALQEAFPCQKAK